MDGVDKAAIARKVEEITKGSDFYKKQ